MDWIKISKNDDYKKMKDWFDKRTKKHIKRVQKYCKKIENYDPEKFKGLIDQGKKHDQSKYKDPEIDPYLYITWKYKCEEEGKDFECPEDMDEKMNEATSHHVLNNRHHPEFHSPQKKDVINKKDRDKPPEKIIDATKMPNLDIGEMVADWMAMSEELESSPRGWAKKNINIRWKFNDEQKDLIYELIREVYEK